MKQRTIIALVIVALLIAGASALAFRGNQKAAYTTVVAERGNVSQEVSVTGKVQPIDDIDLAFEKSGTVRRILAQVGAHVQPGTILVELDTSELAAQLKEAEASVAAEEADLAKLLQGTRSEEVAVKEAQLKDAMLALEDAAVGARDALNTAYTDADNAVRNKADQMFTSPLGTPTLVPGISTSDATRRYLEGERLLIEENLRAWSASLAELSQTTNITPHITSAKGVQDRIKSFLDTLAFAVNGTIAGPSVSQTTLDAWKADLASARSTLTASVASVSAADEKLRSREADVMISNRELDLARAGARPEEIASQQAVLDQARARVNLIRAQIAKHILRSPIVGVVTEQNAKTGAIVQANTSVVSVISDGSFEIEANIPEADIAKIRVGLGAAVTLDAYGSDTSFFATVVEVDPAETVIDGVPTYTTTLHFVESSDLIRSGMTANVDILAGTSENVITVPQRAVFTESGRKYVRVLRGETAEAREVETGLRGSDGNIEILSGVSEGDIIILFANE